MSDPRLSKIANNSELVQDHIHSEQRVYPTLADPVAVTAGAGAWNLSAGFTEIVPTATITAPFDIHYITISDADTNEDYEVVLYAIEVEIARIAFTRTAQFVQSFALPVTTPILPAGTQIQAKSADGTGGAIANLKIFYHTY